MSKHWIDNGQEQPTAAEALAERVEYEQRHDPEARLPDQVAPPTPAVLFAGELNFGHRANTRPLICNGVRYQKIDDAARALGLTHYQLKRILAGRDPTGLYTARYEDEK